MKTIKMHSIELRTGRLGTVVCVGFAATLMSAAAMADVVTDWNQTTLNTLAAVGQRRTPPAGRLLAMVHSAMHDSINAVDVAACAGFLIACSLRQVAPQKTAAPSLSLRLRADSDPLAVPSIVIRIAVRRM